ncbi:hypothetical protein CRUP_028670, partial [Coryphaenoides rupestris]
SRPPQVVPFRDSKLTRVLQGYFCGRGSSCMVVNINPCAGIYDETLQALKFSAIATQSLLRAIYVLKREVLRQRQEKEVLEADVREQVVSEMMEFVSGMQDDFSETLETQKAVVEEKLEAQMANLQKRLKSYYSQELDVSRLALKKEKKSDRFGQ